MNVERAAKLEAERLRDEALMAKSMSEEAMEAANSAAMTMERAWGEAIAEKKDSDKAREVQRQLDCALPISENARRSAEAEKKDPDKVRGVVKNANAMESKDRKDAGAALGLLQDEVIADEYARLRATSQVNVTAKDKVG